MSEKEELIVDNISENKLCPFLMKTVSDFNTDPSEAICLGERCALFQSMNESYIETDENEEPVVGADGQPVIKTKEIKGCAFVLSSRLDYMSVMALADMNRTGHFIAKGFSQMLTPVSVNKPNNSGIVVPRGSMGKKMGPAR